MQAFEKRKLAELAHESRANDEDDYYADPATHGRLLLEMSKNLSTIKVVLVIFFLAMVISFVIGGCSIVSRL